MIVTAGGRWMWRGLLLLSAFALAGSTGCANRGHLEVASLNYQSIDPPSATVARVDLAEAYWWTDGDDRVWIALRREVPSLLGEIARFELQMSFVLEQLPAGEARNYLAKKNELRAVARVGLSESRFVAATGIVALYREKGNRLRGTFRLLARRQVSQILGGWSRPSTYLMQGTFIASHNEKRGRTIAKATEAGGWEREHRLPKKSSQAGDNDANRAQPATPRTDPEKRDSPRLPS